jgi:hypothetical protein
MSRHWRTVSKAMQKLAARLHEVKSEGTFPYETYYVLATDKELERLYDLNSEHVADDNTTIQQRAFARAGLEPSAHVPAR